VILLLEGVLLLLEEVSVLLHGLLGLTEFPRETFQITDEVLLLLEQAGDLILPLGQGALVVGCFIFREGRLNMFLQFCPSPLILCRCDIHLVL
jgi:hypothetical protein